MADQQKAVGGDATLAGLLTAEKLPGTGELADVVAAIEKRYDGKLHRSVPEAGVVRMAIETKGGDRLAAEGPTTTEAVQALRARLEKIANASK